jgi:chromate reductase
VNRPIRLAGLVGSLRSGSYNRQLFLEAQRLVPAGVDLYEVPIRDLPLYDADLTPPPPAVETFFQALREADGLLIVTPEYNYSIPGGLKNAIDWASRDPEQATLFGKPAAIAGASGGLFGTVRAQLHLRHVLMFLDMDVVNKPEVLVTLASQKFDEHGRLTDPMARDLLQQLLQALVEKVRRRIPTPVG